MKKKNPQEHCILFKDALERMQPLNQKGLLVKYFQMVVISPEGNKITLTFDPVKYQKQKNKLRA
jgi:hypothetical protein